MKNLMAGNSFYLINGLISMIELLSVDNFENYFVSLVSITIEFYEIETFPRKITS
jgi:hypothetical protein